MTHEFYMNLALQEALRAYDESEVPVGAVIVKDGRVIGKGYNRMEHLTDATAHAEIIAIGAASASLETWRLEGCTMYVTLEPCLMCLGAIIQSRIETVVYGSTDPRCGAIDTYYFRPEIERTKLRFPTIIPGIMANESSELLKSFFKAVRNKDRHDNGPCDGDVA